VVGSILEMECPLKIRMVMASRIVTWDNGHRRGWKGSNRCALCNIEEEFVENLFVS
jgi:hypothetical protein